MFYESADRLYKVRTWDEFDWLVHGFGTRHFGTRHFGTRHGDAVPATLATLSQIHSAHVVDAAGRTGCLGAGDALIDDSEGALLGIKTADCLPILIVDPRLRAIAAVHAGWRGTAKHIVSETVGAMVRKFGVTPEDLHAAIGPGIGKCCFEVGPEVSRELAGVEERRHIDLASMNRQQLIDSGVRAERIYLAGLCTACNAQNFFSYRMERDQVGRMLSVVGLKNEGREKVPAPGE